MAKLIDLIRLKFDRWTVLEFSHKNNKGVHYWKCQCSCINKTIKIIEGSSLISGKSKSCGCLRSEMSSIRNKTSKLGNKYNLKPYGESSKRSLYNQYKCNAKRRNIIFELTFEEFINLTQQNCYYSKHTPNQLMKNTSGNGDFIYNGIDRLDNTKGYTINNCVSCCGICNKMKMDLPFDTFLEYIKTIYNNLF